MPELKLRRLNPNRMTYIDRHGLAHYKRRYNAGFNAAFGLDRADADGRSNDDAWMDGYLDRASRDDDKWHLLYCQAHHNDEGGCGSA